MNRKIMPPITTITRIELPKFEIEKLSNGIPLYIYNAGTQPVVKINIVFKGGRWLEEKPAVAGATVRMLREGTRTRTSKEIAATVGIFAGTLYMNEGVDTLNISFYCLAKHFEPLLEVVTDCVLNPVFPTEEITTFVENSCHELAITLDKIDAVAYREATASIFGATHPYGYNTTAEMYTALTRDDLVAYHEKNFIAEQCSVVVSGKIDDHILQIIEQNLGKIRKGGSPISIEKQQAQPAEWQQKIEPRTAQLQTAVAMIRPLFNRKHADFADINVLNMILGGFFSSRLMQNIREDKGYTYGIYSSLGKLNLDGYMLISAEVGKKVSEQTLAEIRYELLRLQTELVGDDELEMVRNYMMGSYLQMFDGVFSTANAISVFAVNDLDADFYTKMIDAVLNITPQRLQELAKTYLKPDDFKTVCIG